MAFEDVIRATDLHQLELGIIEGQSSSEDAGTHKGEAEF